MAQAQATTSNQATNNQATSNGEGVSASKREPKAPTAIEAAQKIGKILDQLSPNDRKRVLAFVSESNDPSSSNE